MAVELIAACDLLITRVSSGTITSVEVIMQVSLIKNCLVSMPVSTPSVVVAGSQTVPHQGIVSQKQVASSGTCSPSVDTLDRWHADPLRNHGLVVLKVPEVDPVNEVGNNMRAALCLLEAVGVKATPFSVFRMGVRKAGRCRPIKLILPSTKMVEHVISNTNLIKHSAASGWFVRRSMPRAERNAMQELFEEKKMKERETGRFHRIYDGNIQDSGRPLRQKNLVRATEATAGSESAVENSIVQVPGVGAENRQPRSSFIPRLINPSVASPTLSPSNLSKATFSSKAKTLNTSPASIQSSSSQSSNSQLSKTHSQPPKPPGQGK